MYVSKIWYKSRLSTSVQTVTVPFFATTAYWTATMKPP